MKQPSGEESLVMDDVVEVRGQWIVNWNIHINEFH